MTRRNTIQRSLVLEAVNTLKCHATADEIYELIHKEHPNVSRATVYRNLNALSDDGKIKKLEMPSSADRFDHICSKHYHIKCKKCGRVFDVDMEVSSGLENNIKDRRGFEFTDYDIVFKGICPDCQKA
ncbi:MAG: Fur family transcriptional regulator [Eubacterium sp.]